MSRRVFVDTNILIYAVDASAGRRCDVARELLRVPQSAQRKVISTQVLQEFYSIAVRKLGTSPLQAKDLTEGWLGLDVVVVDVETIRAAMNCAALQQIAFWDAVIVSAADRASCPVLLTEDLNHGQVISGVRIENPFRDLGTSAPRRTREKRAVYRTRRTRK